MRRVWLLIGMLAATAMLFVGQVIQASDTGMFWLQQGSGVEATIPGQVGTGQLVGAEGLSVRTGPFLGASRIDIINENTQHPVIARNTAEGVFTWYLIEVSGSRVANEDGSTTEGLRGWVSGRYFVVDTLDENIPVQGSVFEGLNPGGEGVRGVLRSNMRLRQGPSYRTPTLQILDWGAEVRIIARTTQANENHWFLVRYNDQIGWLYSPFIAIDGDLRTIPNY